MGQMQSMGWPRRYLPSCFSDSTLRGLSGECYSLPLCTILNWLMYVNPFLERWAPMGPLSSWQFVTACHVMNEFHSRYAVFDFYTEAVSGWGHRLGSPISCHGNLRLGSPKQFRMWSTHRLQISSCSAICLRGSAASERSSGIPAIVCVAHFFPPACQPPSAPESQHC